MRAVELMGLFVMSFTVIVLCMLALMGILPTSRHAK